MLTEDGKHLYVSYDEYHNLIEKLAIAMNLEFRSPQEDMRRHASLFWRGPDKKPGAATPVPASGNVQMEEGMPQPRDSVGVSTAF